MLKDLFRKRFSELTEGESAEDISNKTHFTPKYAKEFLKGERCPDIFDLGRIADAYGVTTDYLLGRTEEKEPATAEAGQALTGNYNNSNIAQSEDIVKDFTEFLPILMGFAKYHFGDDVAVQSVEAGGIHGATNKVAAINFTIGDGYKYRITVEGVKEE